MPSKSKSKGGRKIKNKERSKGKNESSNGSKGSKVKDLNYLEIPPVVLKNVKPKITYTSYDIQDYRFNHFRCACCKLALDSFQAFIDHSCWRKYYAAKYHLGCTQAFACRVCEVVFYSHADYAAHVCFGHRSCDMKAWFEPEEVIPISYRTHQDYYINWTKRTERQFMPHEPDYHYVCRCCRCSKRFKSKIEFLLHSCCLFIVLKPANLRRLKICFHCKYVFLHENEYHKHVSYCDLKKAFCVDFVLTTAEIGCQQFVTGRHCFDFDHHLRHGVCFKTRSLDEVMNLPIKPQKPTADTIAVHACCAECGFEQPNLAEFLYHPCATGKRLTPMNLELILFCCECECLFVDIFECVEHLKSCSPVSFYFVRLHTPELVSIALRRWSKEMVENPYLPARQVKFRCSECEEIYRQFITFLKHHCPKRERYEQIFVQPMGVMETYTCEACHIVVFSISEAIEHSKVCKRGCYPHMIQIHYCMEEVIAALTSWMRCPQVLKFNLVIGVGDEADELVIRENELKESHKLPVDHLLIRFKDPLTKPSQRIDEWITKNIQNKSEHKIAEASKLRNMPQVEGKSRQAVQNYILGGGSRKELPV
ncbi:thymidylate kinase 251L [Echinococcus multilocularis]|uniref:Thymidylate kinase 251L n=1 Tax=Echinococcus multilocularis TaxID=6211 RepID=A0A068Y972_ECHMU|nr:thymidylate kinase 251L [Echinococcus multilocularis]